MMTSFLKFLLVIFPLLWTQACKSRSNQSSKEKHLVGETSRDTDDVKICAWQEDRSINIQADRYLAQLAEQISLKNKNTFQGYFSPGNICIYLQKDAQINAYAHPGQNRIDFNSQILLSAPNDAAVASILAHELAHLTMQSTHVEEIPPAVIKHPDWIKVRDKFEVQKEKMTQTTAPLKNKLSSVYNDRDDIEKKWMKILPDPVIKEIREIEDQKFALISSENLKMSADLYLILKSIIVPHFPDINTPEGTDGPVSAPAILPVLKTTDANKAIADLKARQEIAYGKLRKESPDLMKKWEESMKIIGDLNRQIKACEDGLRPFQEEFDLFITTIAGADAKFNWREQEADEVGYEFYLRAGFAPEAIVWLSKSLMGEKSFNECMADHVAKKIPPTRGTGSHPSLCWRIYDYLVLEANYHKNEYTPLIKAAKTFEIIPGELAEVKKSLSQ